MSADALSQPYFHESPDIGDSKIPRNIHVVKCGDIHMRQRNVGIITNQEKQDETRQQRKY